MAVTRSEQAILQAIRSVCDRVGVGSLKEKQIKAKRSRTRLSVPATLRTTVRSIADSAVTVLCSFDVGSG